MRIEAISVKNAPPVKRFEAQALADVVVIAGANGVGKTRLMQALVRAFESPNPSNPVQLEIHATSADERTDWKKSSLKTSDKNDCQVLVRGLQKNRQRTRWEGSVDLPPPTSPFRMVSFSPPTNPSDRDLTRRPPPRLLP